jgi:hypothetical protein
LPSAAGAAPILSHISLYAIQNEKPLSRLRMHALYWLIVSGAAVAFYITVFGLFR